MLWTASFKAIEDLLQISLNVLLSESDFAYVQAGSYGNISQASSASSAIVDDLPASSQ